MVIKHKVYSWSIAAILSTWLMCKTNNTGLECSTKLSLLSFHWLKHSTAARSSSNFAPFCLLHKHVFLSFPPTLIANHISAPEKLNLSLLLGGYCRHGRAWLMWSITDADKIYWFRILKIFLSLEKGIVWLGYGSSTSNAYMDWPHQIISIDWLVLRLFNSSYFNYRIPIKCKKMIMNNKYVEFINY